MLYFWLKHNFLIFFSNQCSNGATRKRPTLQQSPKTAPQQEQLSNKFLCKAAGLKVLQFYKYVFGHCVSGKVCFRGGVLVSVFTSTNKSPKIWWCVTG